MVQEDVPPVDTEPPGQLEHAEAATFPYCPEGQVVQLDEPEGAT
jgi:hypothetical protein